MSGDLFAQFDKMITPTGRRIATATGVGFRLTAGRGLMTSRGVGQHIIMDAGFTTTVTGSGLRTARYAAVAVGGDRRLSFWEITAITSIGVRSLMITAITTITIITTVTTITTGITIMATVMVTESESVMAIRHRLSRRFSEAGI